MPNISGTLCNISSTVKRATSRLEVAGTMYASSYAYPVKDQRNFMARMQEYHLAPFLEVFQRFRDIVDFHVLPDLDPEHIVGLRIH
jgi:hypothetical protein